MSGTPNWTWKFKKNSGIFNCWCSLRFNILSLTLFDSYRQLHSLFSWNHRPYTSISSSRASVLRTHPLSWTTAFLHHSLKYSLLILERVEIITFFPISFEKSILSWIYRLLMIDFTALKQSSTGASSGQ